MKFHCEHCHQRLEIDDQFAGQQIGCPVCQKDSRIPNLEKDATEKLRASLKIKNPKDGQTIAELMADRNLKGGLNIGADVLHSDQNRKYVIGNLIAKGGVGAVFSASDQNVRRNVAMKVLLDPTNASDEDVLRFIEEAQVTGQLEHPSVAPVHDLGVDTNGNVYYVMKMVKGDNLHTILKNIAKGDEQTIADYPLNRLLNIYLKVCDAVRFAHSKNVIHRDLKPENIMVGEFGEVLVMDWGLAKVLGQSREDPHATEEQIQSVRNQAANDALVTIAGAVFGTPQFMAPEQARGETKVMDMRTDIYSLGAILYNILTLTPPFRGKTVDEILTKVSSGNITSPSTLSSSSKTNSIDVVTLTESKKVELLHCPNGRVPSALNAVVMKAMSLHRRERYQTVAELQADIESYQGGFATKAEKAGAVKLAQLFIQRNLLGFISALIISLLGIGFGLKAATDAKELRRVSVEAAPEFIEKAKIALRQQDTTTATKAVQTALALDKDSAQAWYEKGRLSFDQYQFSQAYEELKQSHRLAIATSNFELANDAKTYNLSVSKWKQRVAADGKGVLPEHLSEIANDIQDIDPTLAGRFFSRIGDEQKALSIQVEQAFADILKTNPGLRWKKGDRRRGWPMGIAFFYWADIFKETGMQLKLTSFCDNPEKLIDLTALSNLPIKSLDLSNSGVSDLEPLAKIDTLQSLDLENSAVLSLASLENSSIEELNIANTRINDLTPLALIPVKHLTLHNTDITDYSPLEGVYLETFNHREFAGESIEFLTGMPLKSVNLDDAIELKDITPLAGAPVEELSIINNKSITDLSPLESLPLKRLSIGTPLARDLSIIKDKQLDYLNISMDIDNVRFLKTMQIKWLGINNNLSAKNLTGLESQIEHLEELNIWGKPGSQLADISALKDMRRLKRVRLHNIPVTNLVPLKSLAIEHLELILPNATTIDSISGIKPLSITLGGGIKDVRALRTMTSLVDIDLRQCKEIRNLNSVLGLPNLKQIFLPENWKEFDFLRRKQLQTIGVGNRIRPAQMFWRELDTARKKKKK